MSIRAMPEVPFLVPGLLVRVVFAAVAVWLCLARLPGGFWLAAALAVVALAVVVPRSLAAWVLLVGIGVDQALGEPPSAGIEFAVLVAGVHLLHVLAAQLSVIPVMALVQASVFIRPLLRFVVIQVPVQSVAWIALSVFSPGTGAAVPAVGVVGAVAVIVLSALLAVPLLRERTRD